MLLALIQTRQNRLYNFGESTGFTVSEALELRKEYFDSTIAMITAAAQHGADFIVTTEAVNYSGQFQKIDTPYASLYSLAPSSEENELSKIAATFHTRILAGLIRKESNGKLYNSTLYFNENGAVVDVYHKIHLAGDENLIFSPGQKLHTISTEFGKLGVAICWDMQFPETARNLAKMGCDMIICPTWGWEWLYGPARAYENGIYVAAAMAVPYQKPIQGIRIPSQVISPNGEILATGSCRSTEIVYCDIPNIRCEESRRFRLNSPLAI